MIGDSNANHDTDAQPAVPSPRLDQEPEFPSSDDSPEHPTLDIDSFEARYPDFRDLTMEEFEDILLDEDDPRNETAKQLTSEVIKPVNDVVSRTMASMVDGKLDGVLSPFRKQMSELATSVIPKIDTGSILKSIGADRATQSYLRAISESMPKTSGFTTASFVAAQHAAGISEHLKSLSAVKIPKLSDSIKLPDYSSSMKYPDIASGLKLPKILTPMERYANLPRPEAFRVPDVPLPAARSNSVERWVESVHEYAEKENHELTALESIAASLDKIERRDESESEQRKQDVEKAEKREKNMTRLTWASVIMVGLTLLISGYGLVFGGQSTPIPTKSPVPVEISEPSPPADPAVDQPATPVTPPTSEPAQQP